MRASSTASASTRRCTPRITRRHWFDAPRFVNIAAGGFGLTPDGRVVYKQGAEIEPARYLRVVPNWVERMKRAVAAANP